jgi:hypothetical protein
MTEKLIAQWKTILGLFATEPKEVLAKELVKMIPMKPDFEVDWRRGIGYNSEKGLLQVASTIKVCPVFHNTELAEVNLEDYFATIISCVPSAEWPFLEYSFQYILQYMEAPCFRLSLIPCMEMLPSVWVMRFYIEGKPNELYASKPIKNSIPL